MPSRRQKETRFASETAAIPQQLFCSRLFSPLYADAVTVKGHFCDTRATLRGGFKGVNELVISNYEQI
jgi:hypothetical protein